MSESALARFRARHVGIIFQFFNLLDDLTVEDNVLLPAELAGASRRQARARAGELLARMGIEEHRDAYPARLSGGQRQRVAIARALVNSPELLLADEPTGALDTATGQEIGKLLRQLNEGGQTLVLVTHDQDAGGTVRGPHRAARGRPGRHRRRAGMSPGRRAAGTRRPGAARMSRPGSSRDHAGSSRRCRRDRPGSGSALHWLGAIRTATGGMLRHKVQAAVIGMVLLISTASATLGFALLAASNAPFQNAFQQASTARP